PLGALLSPVPSVCSGKPAVQLPLLRPLRALLRFGPLACMRARDFLSQASCPASRYGLRERKGRLVPEKRSNIPSRLHRCSLLAAPLRDILLSALFSRTHRFPLSFRFGPSAFRRPVLAYYGLC